jgi:predicted ATPase/DNA-binding XRE family transcriptional regulator
MNPTAPGSFGAQLKALREAAGFTQEELATIAGLSVHAVSALERGQRRRPQVDTVRALSAALDLAGPTRDHLLSTARTPSRTTGLDELRSLSLPLAPTAFVGREDELKVLRQWLTDRSVRLITLTGPGGAGKTRLALELAREVAADGTARVVLVLLAAIRDTGLVAAAIAEALGLVDTPAADLPRRVKSAWDGTPTLLVLDNFEQVLEAAPLIAEILSSAASLRVLVTSRAPLHLRGEREYAVGSLALDTHVDARSPGDLVRSAAVRLFLDRVRDVEPDFRLTSANGPTVMAICQRLDALPLALELAAPWLKVLSPDGLLSHLAHGAPLSPVGPRDLPERQQTMTATIAWSYQLLDANERRVFRRLGVLPGRFSIDLATAVVSGASASGPTDDVLRAVAGLIDKSLLVQAETSVASRPLYLMLETVRAFAALELGTADERDAARQGLVRYCLREAASAAEGTVGPAQAEWLNRARDDLDNYRRAMEWLIEQRRPTDVIGIAYPLFLFWGVRGFGPEGLDWYERALALDPPSPAAECALVAAATMCYTLGQMDRARERCMRALARGGSGDSGDWFSQALLMLGHVEHAQGDDEAARELFDRSLVESRRLGSDWRIGNALSGLAWVALAVGKLEEAERLLDEADNILRGTGPWFLLLVLYLRAVLAVRRGNPDEALGFVRASLVQIRDLHDKFAFVFALVPLGSAAVLKGDHAWAARILGAGDAVTEQTGATATDASVADLRKAAEQEACVHLGPDRWARARAAGRAASIDSLIHDIDSRRG